MDRRGASMDAGQDVWDWEVLPDHMSSSMSNDGANLSDDQETKEPMITAPSSGAVDDQGTKEPMIMPPSSGAVDDQETKKEPMITAPSSDEDVQEQPGDEFKDIGVVPDDTKQNKEEAMAEVSDPSAPDAEEEEKTFQSPGTKEPDDDGKLDGEEEDDDVIKKDSGRARPECMVFSVGKLKVNGIGALCSFGVAAATVCIFLIGGKVQQHHHRQQHKIQLQFYSDDKRIQQVVQQTSRLNQAVSSMIGGGGASARANISFGGSYEGF